VSFRHVYLNSEKRGKSTQKDAEGLLAKLKKVGSSSEYTGFGDPSMLSSEFSSTTQREIASLFGEEFTTSLLSQNLNQWLGPIESAYGLHLVIVNEKIDGEIPSLDEVRDIVVRELEIVNKKVGRKQFYEALLKNYTVTIEKPDNESNDLAQHGNGATK
jgi:parvulin-like peptidyl-prolyl isomerase